MQNNSQKTACALTPTDKGLIVSGLRNFSAAQIFDCGQCFRFDGGEEGSGDRASLRGATKFSGVAFGRFAAFTDLPPDENGAVLLAEGVTEEEFKTVWADYFDLQTDYSAIKTEIISRFDEACRREDETIRRAVERGCGIRILRADPFETLISFIISQNNNIPRIKKTIAALCAAYGEPIKVDRSASGDAAQTRYAFPTPEAIAAAGEEGMRALKTGFRAKYIVGAAEAVADGSLDLAALAAADGEEARERLQQLRGVGPKVAGCVSLFGLHHLDAFPVDVWMKKVLALRYPDGLDIDALGRFRGVAQQYLFYNERWI